MSDSQPETREPVIRRHFDPQSQLAVPLSFPRPQLRVNINGMILHGYRTDVPVYQLPKGLLVLADDLSVAEEPPNLEDRAKRGTMITQMADSLSYRVNRDVYHAIRQEGLIGQKTKAESAELEGVRVEIGHLLRLAWILQGGQSPEDQRYITRVGSLLARLGHGVSKERVAAFEMVSRSGSITDVLKRRNAGRLPLYHGSAIRHLGEKIGRYRNSFDLASDRSKVLLLMEADHVAVLEKVGRLAGQAWRSDPQTGPKSTKAKRDKLRDILREAAELVGEAIYLRPFIHVGSYVSEDLLLAAAALSAGDWLDCRRRLSVVERSCYLLTVLRREVERVNIAISEARHLELELGLAEYRRLSRAITRVVDNGFDGEYETPDGDQPLGHQFRGAVTVERMSLDLDTAAIAIADGALNAADKYLKAFSLRV